MPGPNTGLTGAERRQFARIPFDAELLLSGAGHHWEPELLDVSLKGLLIRAPEDWEVPDGTELHAILTLDDQETVIRMDVKVAHVEAGRIGLGCVHLDLDSISHLRRLVELNLGDAALLDRELAALGDDPLDPQPT